MKIFLNLLCLIFTFSIINQNIYAQNVTVNPGAGSYPTMKAAFDAINAGTHTGAVTVSVTGNTTEPVMAILNASGVGSASYTSVTITPSGGPRTISGSDSITLKLSGADNVTIDGRIANTGRNLTITNSSTIGNATAIWLSHGGFATSDSSGAKHNVIRNCEISCGVSVGTATTITNGILSSGTSRTVSGRNNDSNEYLENRIIKCRLGISLNGGSAVNTNDNNTIAGNIVGPESFGADNIGQTGIFVQFQSNCIITKNIVQYVGGPLANTTGGADRIGIAVGLNSWTATTTTTTTGSNYTVTQNIVHDIIDERTFSALGICIGTTLSGPKTNNLIANNVIYTVRGNGTAGDQAVGIGHSGGPGDRIVFNSISMTGDLDPTGATSTSSNPTAAGISKHLASAPDTSILIKDNSILLDVSSNTTTLLKAAIIGPLVGYAFGSGGLDYNDYWVPTPGTNGQVVGVAGTGTVSFTTLALWKGAYSPNQDTFSISADPLYVLNTQNLRPTPGSPLYHAGTTIPGIVDDFLKVARNVTTPTIGAYEDTVSVNLPPNIANTSLSNTFLTGNRALNGVTITDANGIASGALAPRVYWRVNSGSWSSAATSSGSSPYDFTIGTTGLSVGDTVSFFVIAQDNFGLVSANPGLGIVATDVNTVTTFPSNPNKYLITNNPNYGNGATYFYANSTTGASGQPSQPQFCWKDTSGSTSLCVNAANVQSGIYTGTSLDDGFWKVLLPGGKKVRFMGADYDTLRIGTNGILAFQIYDPSFSAGNHNPPVAGIPGGTVLNAFYPLWWDSNFGSLVSSSTNRVSYKIAGNQLVITYDRAPRFNSVAGDYVSYQVTFDVSSAPSANSRILLQIADTTGGRTGSVFYNNYNTNAMATHLTGLQNAAGTSALTYRFRNATTVVTDGPYFNTPIGNLAVQFGPNNTELNNSCKTLNLTFRLEAIQLTRKDTVAVAIIDASDISSIESYKMVYDSTNGTVSVPFTFAENNPKQYYIQLTHRNSIKTYSPLVSFTANSLNYNFTTNICQALGCNQALVSVAGAVQVASIFSGDVNQDNCIEIADVSDIDNDGFNFVCGSYVITDLNFDGCTDVADAAIADNNLYNFVCIIPPPAPPPAENRVLFNYQPDATPQETLSKEDAVRQNSNDDAK